MPVLCRRRRWRRLSHLQRSDCPRRTRIDNLRTIIESCKKTPDIVTIAKRWDKNGNVNIEDIMTALFNRRCFILLQNIEMILQRSSMGMSF